MRSAQKAQGATQQDSCSKSRANMILINTSCQQFLANGCHKLDWAKELLLALVEPRVYVELEALVPKAIARVYMEAPGAKIEAPKQPKKQDETEAPPGWNRSRQGPEKGPNPDGSGRGKIPGFGGRQNLCTFQ